MNRQYKLVTKEVDTDPIHLVESLSLAKPSLCHRTMTAWVVDHTDRDQIFKDFIGQTGYQIAMCTEDHSVALFFPLEQPYGSTEKMHGYTRVYSIDELRAPDGE